MTSLAYGINPDGELFYIDDVPRGRTALACPYCGGPLIAKKGEIKAPHFAHLGETCLDSEREDDLLQLPGYDHFNLHFTGQQLTLLKAFHEDKYLSHWDIEKLTQAKAIEYNPYKKPYGGNDLTKTGKVVFGELSLMLFKPLQEELIADRHRFLEGRVKRA